ncbi:hypothetical protein SB758_33670, partial [Burkholderia sp. SIMBA_013]
DAAGAYAFVPLSTIASALLELLGNGELPVNLLASLGRASGGLLLGTLCGASARRQDIAPQAEEIMRLFSSVIANFLEREQLVAELRTANTKLMAYALT